MCPSDKGEKGKRPKRNGKMYGTDTTHKKGRHIHFT